MKQLDLSAAIAFYAPSDDFCEDWKTFVVVGGKIVLRQVEDELRAGGIAAALAAIESLRDQLIAICDEETERLEREERDMQWTLK